MHKIKKFEDIRDVINSKKMIDIKTIFNMSTEELIGHFTVAFGKMKVSNLEMYKYFIKIKHDYKLSQFQIGILWALFNIDVNIYVNKMGKFIDSYKQTKEQQAVKDADKDKDMDYIG